MRSILHKSILCMALLCLTGKLRAQTDITDNGGTITSQYESPVGNQKVIKLIDNTSTTKYYVDAGTPYWVQYQSAYTAVITQYAITAADDMPERDPKTWILLASDDGLMWQFLDYRDGETFDRFQRKLYTFANTRSFKYYQLVIEVSNGAGDGQFSELELLAPGTPTSIPTGFTAKVDNQNVKIEWQGNKVPAGSHALLERSMNGINYLPVGVFAKGINKYVDSNLCAGQQFAYRMRYQNDTGTGAPTAAAIIKTTTEKELFNLNTFQDKSISDQYYTYGEEGCLQAFDNDPTTKYYTGNSTTYLQYRLAGGAIVKQYAVTSGNDAPERDPRDWVLEGSNDMINWKTVDTRTAQTFADRQTRNFYLVKNNTSYVAYRFRITANNGAGDTQLSDLQLYGTGKGAIDKTAPVAPQGFGVTGVSPFQLVLTWYDASTNEESYELQRSTDSSHWDFARELDANSSKFYSRNLYPLITYYYRLRTENKNGKSAWVYTTERTTSDAAPAQWQEHWGDAVTPHHELLQRKYYDNEVNIYFDRDVDPSITWEQQDFSNVWKYVKKNYGTFCDPKLYIVLHSVPEPQYSGGHPASVFDADHDYRNTVDVAGNWSIRDSWTHGATVHEMCHITEGSSRDIKGSPAFSLWGDSKWGEIFVYDVYVRMGWKLEADTLRQNMQTQYDDYPRANTQWFKNWFNPIYTRADSSNTLARYYTLMSEYFPQHNGEYSRDINMGEFVHFWSGAAKYNLKAQADTAFGWNEAYEMQFRQARIDFPFTYPDEPPVKPTPPNDCHDIKLDPLALYPNPATGKIYLNGPDVATKYIVEVYTLSGQKVLAATAAGKNAVINIASLKDGIYLFVVNDKKGVVFTRKIMVFNSCNTKK